MKLSTLKATNIVEQDIKNSYLLACIYDIEAIKPGNVNLLSGHVDSDFRDFKKSSEITADIISSKKYTLGSKISLSVSATHDSIKKNTNLGIILLCSLFSQALFHEKDISIKDALKCVVEESSSEDVRLLCKSIQVANPAGLGHHETHDVKSSPKINLMDLMKISSQYDNISKQYATSFGDIFDFIIPCLHDSICDLGDVKLAISYTFLKILEKYPDSHLMRKYGAKIAKKTSNEASDLIKILDGDTRHESWGKNLMSLDNHYKMARVNPGTTADLLVVSMMIYDYFIGIPK